MALTEKELNLLRITASQQPHVAVSAKDLVELLNGYEEARELSSATNWFDPETHFGKWAEEDTYIVPGDPNAAHWLLREPATAVKPEATCLYCGHEQDQHLHSYNYTAKKIERLVAHMTDADRAALFAQYCRICGQHTNVCICKK